MSRVALVIDGTAELGLAACIKLGSLGYHVDAICCTGDVRIAQLQSVQQRQKSIIQTYSLDINDKLALIGCIRKIQEQSGQVDILINCAGIRCDALSPIPNENEVNQATSVYLDTVAGATAILHDGMNKQGWGRIVNIYSVSLQNHIYDQLDFSQTKKTLMELTRSWSLQPGYQGITVNMISADCMPPQKVAFSTPELERADDKQGKKLTKAEEVANLAAYMVSDEAAFLSGAMITVR